MLCSSTAHFGQNLSLKVRLLRGAQDQRVSLERIAAFQQEMKAAGYDVTLTALAEGEDAPPWDGPAFEAFVEAILEAVRPTPARTPLPPPISPDFPTGTFFHKHPATYCVLQFNEDGTWAFFWKQPSTNVTGRQPYLRGTYEVDGNHFTETSVTDPNCPWPATYTWTFDGQILTFQVVGEDRCPSRQETWQSPLGWTKQE